MGFVYFGRGAIALPSHINVADSVVGTVVGDPLVWEAVMLPSDWTVEIDD